MKLGDLVSRVTFNFYPLPVFKVPFHLAVDEALLDISLNVGVYAKRDMFFVLLNQDVVEVILNIIQQKDGRA